MTRLGAVIFDNDGVLVDSEELSCGAWIPVLRRQGIEATLEEIEEFLGKTDRDVLQHFERREGRELPERLVAEKQEEYFQQARGRLRTFPGLRDCLETLRDHGLAFAVASSGSPEKIRFSLQEVGLDGFFPVQVSSTEVLRGKPSPDLFLEAAERLGEPPKACAVVEDSVVGIQAAVAAGMRAIGYGSSHPESRLREAGADATFGDYSELPTLLTRI